MEPNTPDQTKPEAVAPLKEGDLDERTRLQVRKDAQKQKQAARQQLEQDRKTNYENIKDEPAFLDILEKAKSFRQYHNKLAIDGVGAKVTGVDESNAPIVEDYKLTDSEVARELGGTSALEQLIVYIENQLS